MSPVDVAALSGSPDCNSSLVVDGLEVRFGGLVAVNGLSLEAPIGRITGLIGPNGAGKSTSFDACFGFTRPSAGRVSFAGVDLTHASVTTRAHLGIGRTFQRIELFDNLSVHHNVALGLEAKLAGRSPLTQLWARRSERQAVDAVTKEMLELCHLGLEDLRAVMRLGQLGLDVLQSSLDLLGAAIVLDQAGVDLVAVISPCCDPEADPGGAGLAHRASESARLPSSTCIVL